MASQHIRRSSVRGAEQRLISFNLISWVGEGEAEQHWKSTAQRSSGAASEGGGSSLTAREMLAEVATRPFRKPLRREAMSASLESMRFVRLRRSFASSRK